MGGLALIQTAVKRDFGAAQGFIFNLYPRFILALLFRMFSKAGLLPVALVCN